MAKRISDSPPILLYTDIALALGVNEALVLQQIHYWISINDREDRNFYEGRYWTYNSLSSWREDYFPFWSFNTVRRTIQSLESQGVLLTGTFNFDSRDRTKWYSIDYDLLEKLRRKHRYIKSPKTNGKAYPRNGEMAYPQSGEMLMSDREYAYAQNGHIYKQAEINYTEINSINLSDESLSREEARAYVKNLIGYDGLIDLSLDLTPWLEDIINLLAEVFTLQEGTIRIGRRNLDIADVKEQFKRLRNKHIVSMIQSLEKLKPDVGNIRSYLLTSLYNAPDNTFFYKDLENGEKTDSVAEGNLKEMKEVEEERLRSLGIRL